MAAHLTPAALCRRLGGAARTRELAQAGFGRRAVAGAVRAGEIERLREGIYATGDLSDEARAAILHGGVLGCVSAAKALGLWVLDPVPPEASEDPSTGAFSESSGAGADADSPRSHAVHVSMPARGHLRRHDQCGCVTHWSTPSRIAGVRVAVADALVQLYRCQGEEAFFVTYESAVRKRLLTGPAIAAVRAELPRRGRWLVDFARGDADSGLESLLRLRLARLGIELRPQVDITGVGVVDFMLGERLIIEVDGKVNHDGPSERHKDLVRDAVAAAHGLVTLRFDYALVIHDWELVETAILSYIANGRHERPASQRRI